MALSLVELSQEKDIVQWRWTSDGDFSVASAYSCQLQGSIVQFPAEDLWLNQNANSLDGLFYRIVFLLLTM
jgi:hypothetical protein